MEETKTVSTPTEILNEAILNLFSICKELQDNVYNNSGKRPHWTNCSNRLESCYHKVNDPEGFKDTFKLFHEKYHSEYTKTTIFLPDEEDDTQYTVADDFFSSEQVYDQSGAVVSIKVANENKKGKSWNKIPILRGPIIYYDYEDKRTSGVNLPIGEIYRTSSLLYQQMEKDGVDDIKTRSSPGRLLHAFFDVIDKSFTEDYPAQEIVKENITMLKGAIDELDNCEEEETETGGPFGTIRNIFKKVIPTLTGGKNSLLPKEAEKMFKGILDDKSGTLDNIGDLFSEVSTSIEKGASEAKEAGKTNTAASITTMLDNISTTLKSEAVVNKLGNIANKLGDLSTVLAPPTATNIEKPVESTEGNDAADQD
jgi:hypothetical protein